MLMLAIFFVVLPFGFVLLYGAPYLPTRKKQAGLALDLLNLKEGEVFVDLGSGDGAVVIEAAKRGLICYGYELNPLVWLVSKVRTYKYRDSVHIYCRNFWKQQLPEDTKGVFVFLLDKYMARLDQKLSKELTGARVASYTFKIPGKPPQTTKEAMFIYKY